METGKIELNIGAIRDLVNDMINLRLDLQILKKEVASLRKAQPPPKKRK